LLSIVMVVRIKIFLLRSYIMLVNDA